LPAAKAALVALMQNTRSAAAAISIASLMARFLRKGWAISDLTDLTLSPKRLRRV
jgi:hypothetical protein